MKELILRMAGATALLAVLGCQNEGFAPEVPAEAPRLDILPSSATGNIAGSVTDIDSGDGISGAYVWFLDASNAETLGEVSTKSDGTYDSGALPIGDSRIRFGDVGGGKGWYPPVFYGAGGFDDFCQGSVVTVASSATTVVDQSVESAEPAPAVLHSGSLGGTVIAGETGDPVQGIQVDFRDAASTLVVATDYTAADGSFGVTLTDERASSVRIRFSDPSTTYLPQYYGASGLDVFCDATPLDVDGKTGLGASLDRVPPASQTEALLETVDELGLADTEGTVLVTPLTRLVVLLSDGSSANDAAACGELRGFLSRIDVQERRGVLTTEEADELRVQTATLQQTLGCS